MILTNGARHDAPVFDQVWDEKPELPALEYAALDKAHDRDHIRSRLEQGGVQAVIPPKANWTQPITYDAEQ